MEATATPILIVGAGRMGGALMAGWKRARACSGRDLIMRDPAPGPEALAAGEDGARLNPPDGDLARARTVVMAVKPQIWRRVADEIAPHLAPDAVIVSILAGVSSDDLKEALGGRGVARAMPNTATAIGKGATAIFAHSSHDRGRAHSLFEPLGVVIDLNEESLMHAATAAGGSAPAYLYAFIEALEAAAAAAGLEPMDAARLATAAVTGAAALLDRTGEDAGELRRHVTSPGGTTDAALKVLMGEDGLGPLVRRAVVAAVARSKELGG